MEKLEKEISAILEQIGNLKVELDAVEKEVRRLDSEVGGKQESPAIQEESAPQEPIDISISDVEMPVPAPAPEPVEAPSPAPAPAPASMPAPDADSILGTDEDLPEEPRKPRRTVMDTIKAEHSVKDAMAGDQSWRTDIPGSQVKNVISAISLNDRVLLINVLFKEDAEAFQNTITAFNGMGSLDEALAYINEKFPDWDLNSEAVYRLMMAVRRKLN